MTITASTGIIARANTFHEKRTQKMDFCIQLPNHFNHVSWLNWSSIFKALIETVNVSYWLRLGILLLPEIQRDYR